MLCRNSIRAGVTAMAILFTTAFNNNVLAAPIFADGDMITFPQGSWGGNPTATNAAGLLLTNYNAVYASTFGLVEVGLPGMAGFSITFSNPTDLLTYLPALGPYGSLNSDYSNPSSTESGAFGGEVLALRLNVDFSDAGLTLGALGIPFGDLTLVNFSALPQLDGLSVRQFLGVVNTALGGGFSIPTTIAELAAVTSGLNSSFAGGNVFPFAEDHLRFTRSPTQVPEPATVGLVLLGLLGLGRLRRRSRV